MDLIFTSLMLAPYVITVFVAFGCVVAVIAASNDFRVGLWITTVGFVVDVATMQAPMLRLGITLYAADVPILLIALSAAIRWAGAAQLPRRHPAWLVFALAFLADIAIGLAKHGTSAGVQARPEFFALATCSYAMSFPIQRRHLQAMLGAMAWAALALALLAVYRWVVYLTPITSLLPQGGVYNIDGAMRVVNSNVALLLAQVALMGVFFFGSGLAPALARLLAPLMLMTVLALQHRSVWLAGLVGACTSMLVARGTRTPWWQQMLLVGVAVAATAAPLVLSKTLSGEVQSSATRAVQGQGTVSARFDNWEVTIAQWARSGPVALLVGTPPGGDSTRSYYSETGEKILITFGTHNNYVQLLTSHGILGLATWCWLVALALRGLWRARRAEDEQSGTASMLFALLCSQLAYYVAYDADSFQAFILGAALAWVFQMQREAAKASTSSEHGSLPVPPHDARAQVGA